jgi:uncharacterized protein with GYD domain
MPYRIASTLTFTDTYTRMTDEEQMAEQVAALEIVANNGGTIEAQYALWTDGAVLSVVNFPDQQACIRCELQITQRGAFQLRSQAALTIDEVMTLNAEAKAQATVKI